MALEVKRVTKADIPKSASPGRTRKESDFDEIVPDAYAAWQTDPETAWYAVPYDGSDDEFNRLKSELTRAVDHLGHGKTTRAGVDEDTKLPTFWFQVRDKIKSGPKGPRNVGTTSDETESSETPESTPDVPEQNGATGRKRRRDHVNA